MKSLLLKEDGPQIMWLFDRWLDQLSGDLVLEAAKQKLVEIAVWRHLVIFLWTISAVSFFCDFLVGALFGGFVSAVVLLCGLTGFKWEFLSVGFRFRRDYRRLCRFFGRPDLSSFDLDDLPVKSRERFIEKMKAYLSTWHSNPFLSCRKISQERRGILIQHQLLKRFGFFDEGHTLEKLVTDELLPYVRNQVIGRG